ncbi:hypothetical protein DPEC_G00361940 [Dallia pectoralis]|nr:hypothetical protein DPEC_G00361940 [Dallia pectoralis]
MAAPHERSNAPEDEPALHLAREQSFSPPGQPGPNVQHNTRTAGADLTSLSAHRRDSHARPGNLCARPEGSAGGLQTPAPENDITQPDRLEPGESAWSNAYEDPATAEMQRGRGWSTGRRVHEKSSSLSFSWPFPHGHGHSRSKECLLNTDPSIAHLLDHSLSRSDFEFNGQYYLQRYMAQQTVSKRIKRTPEGIDRTGVQLAGGVLVSIAIASYHKRSEVATGLPRRHSGLSHCPAAFPPEARLNSAVRSFTF